MAIAAHAMAGWVWAPGPSSLGTTLDGNGGVEGAACGSALTLSRSELAATWGISE